jgi:large subunit ribosomal protein L22
MPETAARLRYSRVSPPKVRQVLHLIVGKDVVNAREILRFCERGPAEPVMKLLDSAVANAEHNDNVPEDELFVLRAFADEGPTQKRWRPRARGRGTRIRKRTSHITIVVSRFDEDELDRRRERDTAASGPARVSRRRRVAASQRRAERMAAQQHDHDHDDDDHDDHDHDHDDDDVVDAEIEEVAEATDDTELLQTEAPMTEADAAEEFVNGEEAVEEAAASAKSATDAGEDDGAADKETE